MDNNNNNSLTKTKYKYTINNVKYPVYKTKNNKHIAMVGGKKKYVDMTKHPSFKGGNEKRPLSSGSPQDPQQGSPKIPKKESDLKPPTLKELMSGLPTDIEKLIEKMVTTPATQELNLLNNQTPTKKNVSKIIEKVKSLYLTSSISFNKKLEVINELKELMDENQKNAQALRNEFITFTQVLQHFCDSNPNTPLNLFYTLMNRYRLSYIFVTYINPTNSNHETTVRINYTPYRDEDGWKMELIQIKDPTIKEKHTLSMGMYQYDWNNPPENNFQNLLINSFKFYYNIIPEKLGFSNDTFYIKRVDVNTIHSDGLEDTEDTGDQPHWGQSTVERQETQIYNQKYSEFMTEKEETPKVENIFVYTASNVNMNKGGRRNFRKTTTPSRNPKTSPVVRKATTSTTTNATRRSTSSSSGVSNATSTSTRRSKKN